MFGVAPVTDLKGGGLRVSWICSRYKLTRVDIIGLLALSFFMRWLPLSWSSFGRAFMFVGLFRYFQLSLGGILCVCISQENEDLLSTSGSSYEGFVARDHYALCLSPRPIASLGPGRSGGELNSH